MSTTHRNHVLFLVENASVPLDRRVWKEALVVKEMGNDVSIVCPRGKKFDTEKRITLEGVSVYRYPHFVMGTGIASYAVEYLNALFWSAWLIFVINLRKRIDIFHVGNPPDIFFVIIQWYRLFGAKHIFDIHDLFVNTFESKYQGKQSSLYRIVASLLRCVERWNITCADFLILTNNSYREYVTTTHHFPESKTAVVRNAPPLDNRNDVLPDPTLKQGKKHLVVYFGVMGEDDGVDVILKAMHYLVYEKHFDDVYCALIGPTEIDLSPAILTLQHMHNDLKLESHVGFTGYLPWSQIHQYLKTADVGISPDPFTMQNNLSTMIKMMEYMSHGLAIVSFDLKENRYSAGNAALYCETFDFKELAEKIRHLLEHEDLRRQMSEAGLARYRTQFNWSVSRTSLQDVYHTLAGGE